MKIVKHFSRNFADWRSSCEPDWSSVTGDAEVSGGLRPLQQSLLLLSSTAPGEVRPCPGRQISPYNFLIIFSNKISFSYYTYGIIFPFKIHVRNCLRSGEDSLLWRFKLQLHLLRVCWGILAEIHQADPAEHDGHQFRLKRRVCNAWGDELQHRLHGGSAGGGRG